MILWKDFLMGCIKKIQKHKEERDRSGKFKKTRTTEWRKEREEIFAYLAVPILMCSPLVGDALGLPLWWYSPSREPTVWEPPLQQHKIGKEALLHLSSS
jgi:hypothetical protein